VVSIACWIQSPTQGQEALLPQEVEEVVVSGEVSETEEIEVVSEVVLETEVGTEVVSEAALETEEVSEGVLETEVVSEVALEIEVALGIEEAEEGDDIENEIRHESNGEHISSSSPPPSSSSPTIRLLFPSPQLYKKVCL
jgi:hypothetical protein